MKKRKMKRIAGLILAIACSLQSAPMTVSATTTEEKIQDANKKLDDLKEQKQQADAKKQGLEAKKTQLSGELANLNAKLQELSTRLEATQTQLNEKQGEIKETKRELKKAKAVMYKQYDGMKDRIRYIYENGVGADSYLEVFLESDSIAELLNRVNYVSEINKYDQNMLEKFQKAVEEVDQQKAKLEGEKKDLEKIKDDQESQQAQVAEVVEQTQATMEENNKALADAQAQASAYDDQIAQQKKYEAQLEAQKAKEDAERLEKIRRQEEAQKRAQQAANPTAEQSVPQASGSDQQMLAALIECEAGGEPYEVKLAVGSVVMNRVRSGSFPGTLSGVIYQAGQFSPVASGRFATVLGNNSMSGESRSAASAVLGGSTTNGFLYFRTNTGSIAGTVIGNMVFY